MWNRFHYFIVGEKNKNGNESESLFEVQSHPERNPFIHLSLSKRLKNVLFIGASQLVEQVLFFCAFQVGGGKRESSARKRAGEGLDTLEGRSA